MWLQNMLLFVKGCPKMSCLTVVGQRGLKKSSKRVTLRREPRIFHWGGAGWLWAYASFCLGRSRL